MQSSRCGLSVYKCQRPSPHGVLMWFSFFMNHLFFSCNESKTNSLPFNSIFYFLCFGADGGSENDDRTRLCPQVPATKKPPSFPSIVGEAVSVPCCRKHPKQPQLAATKGSMQSSVGLNQG